MKEETYNFSLTWRDQTGQRNGTFRSPSEAVEFCKRFAIDHAFLSELGGKEYRGEITKGELRGLSTQAKDEVSRETLELMIEAAIRVSGLELTAGAVHRIVETSTGKRIASRSTVQRILDAKAELGEYKITIKPIEKNGHIIEARHYSRA